MKSVEANYHILSFSSEDIDSILFTDLERFCLQAEQDTKLPNHNWQLTNWENRSETLLYCLLKTCRFSRANGEMTAIYDNDRIVALSGVYLSDFAPKQVAIGGVRAHTLVTERSKFSRLGNGFLHGDLIFPLQQSWAEARGLGTFALTFNLHNRWLAEFILRIGQNKAVGLGFRPTQIAQEFYQGFKLWPRPVNIKNTAQHLLYKSLQPDLAFDFSSLEIHEVIPS